MKEEEAKNTAERVLIAARAVFAENGYSGTRMDAIATRAGVNKATLYYQIGDKDTLYANVIHQVLGNVAKEIAAAVAKEAHPEKKLLAYIYSIASAVEKNPELPSIMLREIASDGAHLPRVVVEDIASVIMILVGILEDGKKKGIFTDVAPFLVHSMIVGAILFYKKVFPIRDKHLWLPPAIIQCDEKAKDSPGEDVARFVLKAIRKSSGGKF